jgi:hypothetical protein
LQNIYRRNAASLSPPTIAWALLHILTDEPYIIIAMASDCWGKAILVIR